MSEFDDLFADDSQQAEGQNDDDNIGDGESYVEKLKREKGYKSDEDIAKAYYHADKHIEQIQKENAHYKDWIQNRAAAAVKLAKEYIETDAYKQKYGQGIPSETKEAKAQPDQSKQSPDIEEQIKNVVNQTIQPQVQQLSGTVHQMSESQLLRDMKENKTHFPHMTEEVEKDIKKFLSDSKSNGQPYPVNPSSMVNLYNAFVGKNINNILKYYRDTTRQEVLRDIAEGKESASESDRAGEGGIPKNDETANDIVNMFNSYDKPLSFR
jgi:ElaB/YqjD/DUF883 family membrane-anchored ribosome-binding protein